MNPETVLLTVRAVAEAATETFKFLNTPAGQKAAEKALADREAWDRNWKAAGDWLAALFAGKL